MFSKREQGVNIKYYPHEIFTDNTYWNVKPLQTRQAHIPRNRWGEDNMSLYGLFIFNLYSINKHLHFQKVNTVDILMESLA